MASTEDILSNFDPTDLKHQVSIDHKPDKESTWPYPKEKDGFIYAHNSLRESILAVRETMEIMKSRNDSLTSWQIKALSTACSAHLVHMDDHHKNEDEIFAPFARKRYHYPEKIVAEHDELYRKIKVVRKAIHELQEGSTVDPLLARWIEYQDTALPHMWTEEVTALPLTRAYYTPEELHPVVMEMFKDSPKISLGAFIYFLGADRFRNEFMKQEGIPFFVWYISFNQAFKVFKREFIDNLDALKSGTELPSSNFGPLYLLAFLGVALVLLPGVFGNLAKTRLGEWARLPHLARP